MAIDTFIRGVIAAQDLEFFSDSIVFRGINYATCILFLTTITLLKNSHHVSTVRNVFLFSLSFRIFSKLLEGFYVWTGAINPGPKRMLVEFNVSTVLDLTILQSTGLYSFRTVS